jgi:hypothetical protein
MSEGEAEFCCGILQSVSSFARKPILVVDFELVDRTPSRQLSATSYSLDGAQRDELM